MKVESWQASEESKKRIAEAIEKAGKRVVWVRHFDGPWIRT